MLLSQIKVPEKLFSPRSRRHGMSHQTVSSSTRPEIP